MMSRPRPRESDTWLLSTRPGEQKGWKRQEHHRERQAVRALTHRWNGISELYWPHPKLYGNPWLSSRDR